MASLCQCVMFVSLCLFHVNGFTPRVYYMDQQCTTSLTVSKDLRLKLTKYTNTKLDMGMNCFLMLDAKVPGDRLMITVRSFHTKSSPFCTKNSLQIDDENVNPLNGDSGDCGVVTDKVYTAPTGSVSFRFKTDFITQTGQFDILLTAFSDSPCEYGRFKCNNDHCVSPDLKCNGYNDCGDNSDENTDCGSLGTGPIAGIAVGAIVFIVIVVVLVLVVRHRRRHCVTDTHCHSGPPACAPASYPSHLKYGY
ncbi:neuropilin and tolloid-like protein 2 isoform X3 [Haliotis rubra]|uniref:neuropilin and tolloid-like protein 2 isoform X3 n=1 Tax=Haliotis rubra TaxID=36100 RepID=UPI001EE5E16A|nr:neuropilin and tolloid-like protein 2 isoform X3 [Haliotis rubra]